MSAPSRRPPGNDPQVLRDKKDLEDVKKDIKNGISELDAVFKAYSRRIVAIHPNNPTAQREMFTFASTQFTKVIEAREEAIFKRGDKRVKTSRDLAEGMMRNIRDNKEWEEKLMEYSNTPDTPCPAEATPSPVADTPAVTEDRPVAMEGGTDDQRARPAGLPAAHSEDEVDVLEEVEEQVDETLPSPVDDTPSRVADTPCPLCRTPSPVAKSPAVAEDRQVAINGGTDDQDAHPPVGLPVAHSVDEVDFLQEVEEQVDETLPSPVDDTPGPVTGVPVADTPAVTEDRQVAREGPRACPQPISNDHVTIVAIVAMMIFAVTALVVLVILATDAT